MKTQFTDLDLQRCVDGELPLQRRRELLERVEQSTDGWKTLALAFLDHQTFDSALAEFRDDPLLRRDLMAERPREHPAARSSHLWQWATLAAAVIAAFWLGQWRSGPQTRDIAAAPLVNELANEKGPGPLRTFADEAGSTPSTALASGNGVRPGRQPAAVLKLPFSDSDLDTLQIPVYERDPLSEGDVVSAQWPLKQWPSKQWPSNDEPNLLSSQGYRVTREKNVLSIPLAGGDTVYVPVEVSGVRYAVQ